MGSIWLGKVTIFFFDRLCYNSCMGLVISRLKENQVIVATSQVLHDAYANRFINNNHFSLIVIFLFPNIYLPHEIVDECHNAVGDHPCARLFNDHVLKQPMDHLRKGSGLY